jgi:hypothetical protein
VINISENIIKTITVLQRSHQVNMKVRKMSLGNGDGLRHKAGVAMDLALLAAQAGARSGGDVVGSLRHTNLDETMRWEASLPG